MGALRLTEVDWTTLSETDAPFTDICKGVPARGDHDTCLVNHVMLGNAPLATRAK